MPDIRKVYRGTCRHCEAEGQRLAKLVVVCTDGTRRTLLVCRFCFLALKRQGG